MTGKRNIRSVVLFIDWHMLLPVEQMPYWLTLAVSMVLCYLTPNRISRVMLIHLHHLKKQTSSGSMATWFEDKLLAAIIGPAEAGKAYVSICCERCSCSLQKE